MRPPQFQQVATKYTDNVIDHYENPRNVGSFKKGEEGVGTGLVGAPACGDVMKLQVSVTLCSVLNPMLVLGGMTKVSLGRVILAPSSKARVPSFVV
jgi:hypothetical protein